MAPTTTVPAQRESLTSALLRSGVPLTLLLDLADPQGPHSRELYRSERPARAEG